MDFFRFLKGTHDAWFLLEITSGTFRHGDKDLYILNLSG